jgi:hypothetical protein
MAGNVGLGCADGIGQLANTEFLVLHEQQQAPQPCVVGEGGKEFFRVNIHVMRYTVSDIFLQVNIVM